jgi:hypothetical protein
MNFNKPLVAAAAAWMVAFVTTAYVQKALGK